MTNVAKDCNSNFIIWKHSGPGCLYHSNLSSAASGHTLSSQLIVHELDHTVRRLASAATHQSASLIHLPVWARPTLPTPTPVSTAATAFAQGVVSGLIDEAVSGVDAVTKETKDKVEVVSDVVDQHAQAVQV
ncbi:unnamed protein product [Protopolystoma xenopodis]|uniref:Uncharacterized protein n=1 Tax=Protopolystoma xenopodis TaxID=117903 RepID=A0A448X3I4_9PLAT|nr:unnamed protein product [Protopolystoma xenopodis]